MLRFTNNKFSFWLKANQLIHPIGKGRGKINLVLWGIQSKNLSNYINDYELNENLSNNITHPNMYWKHSSKLSLKVSSNLNLSLILWFCNRWNSHHQLQHYALYPQGWKMEFTGAHSTSFSAMKPNFLCRILLLIIILIISKEVTSVDLLWDWDQEQGLQGGLRPDRRLSLFHLLLHIWYNYLLETEYLLLLRLLVQLLILEALPPVKTILATAYVSTAHG